MTVKMTPPVSDDQRWDLTAIFPGLNSAEYESYVRGYETSIAAFSAGVATLGAFTGAGIADWTARIRDLEKLERTEQQLSGYVACVHAEQPGNSAVTKAGIRLQRLHGMLKSGKAALLQKLAPLSDQQFARLAATAELASGGYRIELLRRESKIALSERDETLIAELTADGRDRWARVAAETLAQTTLVLQMPSGASEKRPMSERYELASSPDARIRRATFDALNAAFEPRAPLMAHCLNAMAGTGIALARRRGIDPIEESLFDNWIKRETVETMQAALRANASVLQDYLRSKAKLLGLPTMGIYDRYASLDIAELNCADVRDAESRIIGAFEEFCPTIADYTRDAIAGRWIETEMRAGKQLGGFCASLPETRETRIFMSFAGSFNASAMLAHELGHGYHAHVNFPRRFWNQNAPSSLSETASILCEHFLRRSTFLSNALPRRVRLGALAAQLDSAVNYLLRLPRDFEFEVAFYRERANGDVGADRLCELMRNAHSDWFGSALTGDDGDALSWSYNHIMMVPDYRIYNFPYSFGYLLSSRIADAFAEQGKSFTPTYDAFLRATSTLPVEEAVSSTLGFDVTTEAFWQQSLAGVADQLRLFSELAS